MARIEPNLIDETIKRLAIQGVNATEIHRRLMAGKAELPAPLEPGTIACRTVQLKAARYKEQARFEGIVINPGEEIDTLTAILRESIRVAGRELRAIKAKKRLTREDAIAMREWARTGAEIMRHFERREPASRQSHAGNEQRTKATPVPTLERLARADVRANGDQEETAPHSPHSTPTSSIVASG